MSSTPNEVEALLLDSLRLLQTEFEEREKHLTEQYTRCMTALEQQSMVLEDRFQRLTEQYNETMEISASIDRRLKSLMSYIERL